MAVRQCVETGALSYLRQDFCTSVDQYNDSEMT